MALVRMGTALLGGLLLLSSLSGCPKDPYDADTWIDKLDDPREAKQAIDRLAELKDPKAIKPLGAVWKKHSKSSHVLRVIIQLADQPKERGGPKWGDAVPFLVEALAFEIGDNRSIEDAMAAADALGRAKDPQTVQPLIAAVNYTHAGKPLPLVDPGQNVRVAAMRALGSFGNDPRALETLVKVLNTDPLDDETRDNPEAQLAAAKLRGAAANALGATKNPQAVGALVTALFQIDIIFPQVRSALTQMGDPAIPVLVQVFKGDNAEVNKLAQDNNFAKDCSKGEGPGTTCVAPGAIAYKSAIVLGDLRAKQAIPVLIDGLKKPAKTSFFGPGGVPGPPDHNGILDALRKIGDSAAADVVGSYMKDAKTDDVFVRPIAIDVYSMLSRDGKEMGYLAGEMKNDKQEVEEIRKSAGLAYARLVKTKDQLAPIDFMIDRYADQAKKELAKAAAAKKKEEKEDAEDKASGYRDFSILFWQHKVRALVGVTCRDDVKCYLKFAELSPDAIVTELKIPSPIKLKPDDPDTLPKDLKETYQIAAQERSLLEIAKLGPKAAEALPALLKLADSTDRLVREGVTLAMVQIAKRPCDECVKRLDEVIQAQEGQDRLSLLTADTRVVRNYFAGSGAGAPR